MEKIKVTFLGTSDMIPTPERSHSAIFLRYKTEGILIDCGEGTQVQFRKAKINPCKITRILITHWHGDHVLGLLGLIQTLAQNEYPGTLKIYGPAGTKNYLKTFLKSFVMSCADHIKIDVKEIIKEGTFINEAEFKIQAHKLKHRCPSLAYSFIEKDKIRIDKKKIKKLKLSGPIIGKLQKGQNVKVGKKTIKSKDIAYVQTGRKVTTILDTRLCDNCVKAGKNADLLITESTFLSKTHQEKASKTGHLTAKQAAEIAKKAKVKKLFLTHLSQRYKGKEDLLLKEAKQTFKNTVLAKDLMEVEI